MSLPIYRLRRFLVVIAALFMVVIAGMYFYARQRARNVLREIPNKIGLDIKQTASGFQVSKSDGKRTLFTIEAKDLKQFKLNGRAELHNVSIVVYGRDSSRFDQIYGDDFSYDKQTGNVTARGEVQIDLEANPGGLSGPDQGAPRELKNPIHLKTSNLVFNQESGNAHTDDRVDFRTPQASGWGVGVDYSAKTNTLTLISQIHVDIAGDNPTTLFAARGKVTRDPRVILLDHARMERASGSVQAEEATFFLGSDNTVERVLAKRNVAAQTAEKDKVKMLARADEAEMDLSGKGSASPTATLDGNVHLQRTGPDSMEGDAGHAILDFSKQNELKKVRASERVRLTRRATSQSTAAVHQSSPQDFEIMAPGMDFFVSKGRHLDYAQTAGAGQITISSASNSDLSNPQSAAQRTIITAGRFDAKFDENSNRLTSVHGAPNTKIVSSAAGQPDRVSTSQTFDASFLPDGSIEALIQEGDFAYSDQQPAGKRVQAWADKALYKPADHILLLSGSPRIADGGMATTANRIRINRATDEALAEGDVKSTYSELKEQPTGALLASASPIHVTAASMTARTSTGTALYRGGARLWQDANVIEAPTIEFDRNHRSLTAEGSASQPVYTVLVQGKSKRTPAQDEHKSKSNPKNPGAEVVAITSSRLTYSDGEQLARYEGGVVATGTNFKASANAADAYLRPRGEAPGKQTSEPGQLDHLVVQGKVILQQPARHAEGQKLIYTASDDKFVLTGGPPSIFDAERGRITGVSLTFFRGDDRVLVEGELSTPVVTQTRVAR